MSPLAIVLSSLTVTSLLVALALGIAWRRFGREPHAALWAAGFAASSIGHLAQLADELFTGIHLPTMMLAANSAAVSMVLLALGFRRRGGHAANVPLAVATTMLAASAATAFGHAFGDPRLPRVVIHLIASAALASSAIAVRDDRGGIHAPGIATMRILFAFAGYCAMLAAAAMAVSPDGPMPLPAYSFLLLVGAPAGMTAIGLGALLLLGGDLAERLHRLAEIDPLTGVLNRRGVERSATRLVAQAIRGNRPLTVVVADLDRFKAINDAFGHAFGDVVLRRFADHAARTVRASDLVGRLGGEEFVLVLTEAGGGDAAEMVERMRAGLAAAMADLAAPVVPTASFGIAALGDRNDTLEAMIARADAALYRSKEDGRDRVSFAPVQTVAVEPRFRGAWLRDAGDRPGRDRARAG